MWSCSTPKGSWGVLLCTQGLAPHSVFSQQPSVVIVRRRLGGPALAGTSSPTRRSWRRTAARRRRRRRCGGEGQRRLAAARRLESDDVDDLRLRDRREVARRDEDELAVRVLGGHLDERVHREPSRDLVHEHVELVHDPERALDDVADRQEHRERREGAFAAREREDVRQARRVVARVALERDVQVLVRVVEHELARVALGVEDLVELPRRQAARLRDEPVELLAPVLDVLEEREPLALDLAAPRLLVLVRRLGAIALLLGLLEREALLEVRRPARAPLGFREGRHLGAHRLLRPERPHRRPLDRRDCWGSCVVVVVVVVFWTNGEPAQSARRRFRGLDELRDARLLRRELGRAVLGALRGARRERLDFVDVLGIGVLGRHELRQRVLDFGHVVLHLGVPVAVLRVRRVQRRHRLVVVRRDRLARLDQRRVGLVDARLGLLDVGLEGCRVDEVDRRLGRRTRTIRRGGHLGERGGLLAVPQARRAVRRLESREVRLVARDGRLRRP
mmetsp:Transcript_17190/g.69148  ORF Transcript_17190/g.69148 Transcript_17190/m.69148 type:complete len:506 (+) Transcript_17190:1315-2832(+)